VNKLIHPDDALKTINSVKTRPLTELVKLKDAVHRIMPDAVTGSMDQPPFDKASMDGWGWNAGPSEQMPSGPLKEREKLGAGYSTDKPVHAGECVHIMTGAPTPPGVSRIQRVEWSLSNNGYISFTKPEHGDNIIKRGENSKKGELLLSPRLLHAQDIAILASDGHSHVRVSVKPRVALLSTGTELKEPGMALKQADIYDSNRYQLMTQLSAFPCIVADYGIVKDDYKETVKSLKLAMEENSLVILSGGVSMGEYDYGPKALKELGVKEVFHGVAVKPGKPTYYGTKGACHVLGLPGNPVSVFINTEVFVKALLAALSGLEHQASIIPTVASQSISRGKTDRVEFLPVAIDDKGCFPVPYGGSSAIQALGKAAGFVRLEIGQSEIRAGSICHVRLIR